MTTKPEPWRTWAIGAALDAEDPALLACPRCGDTQMRFTGLSSTRSIIEVSFACCVCEQTASLHLDCDRMQSRATWRWSR